MLVFEKTFPLVVPKKYVHDTQLDSFRRKHSREFFLYNDAITDENFCRVTDPLRPGQKLEVKLFGVCERTRVFPSEARALLRKENALLVGAQGVSLVYELAKEEIPYGRWAISFDKKLALWKDPEGNCRFPGIGHVDIGYGFDLGYDGWPFNCGRCVLCFRAA